MCCPVYRLYYHMWGFHLQTKTNETAFQLFGWASVKTCCPLWFRLSVLCIVCTHVHLLVCLHNKERDSNYENTQKKKREWEGKTADGCAAVQGDVDSSPPKDEPAGRGQGEDSCGTWGTNMRQKDQWTDGQSIGAWQVQKPKSRVQLFCICAVLIHHFDNSQSITSFLNIPLYGAFLHCIP